jgi:hypothetical protein
VFATDRCGVGGIANEIPCHLAKLADELNQGPMLRWVEENSIRRGPRSSAMSLSIFAIGAPTRRKMWSSRSACRVAI